MDWVGPIGGLGRVRRIYETYDSNATQPTVKTNFTTNPTHQPLKTDPTRHVELDQIGFSRLAKHPYKRQWKM